MRSQGEEPLRYFIKRRGAEAAPSGIQTLALMDSAIHIDIIPISIIFLYI
jgi:hypothetical protein